MSPKKEPIEIECSGCGARFRLWVPVDLLPEWEKGERINCFRCGVSILIKKSQEGFETICEEGAKKEIPTEKEAVDTVLFVDDDRLALEMVEHTLKESGFNVLTARSGEEALDKINLQDVNLIITDMYLKNPNEPGSSLDGEDLLRKIADRGYTIPAIITTGKDIIDEIALDPKWFELRVKGFVQKGNPFWVDELKSKIKEVLFKD